MPVVRNAVGYLSFLTLFGHPTGEYSFLPLDALAVVWICILLFSTQGFPKIVSAAFFLLTACELIVWKTVFTIDFPSPSMLLRKKSGTWIRWKPSWCWISTSTARFDPTTFRLGNQKTVPLVEMFCRRTYDVCLVVKSWTRLSLTICPLKNVKIVVSNGNWSIFQWHKWDAPKKEATYTKDRYHRKDYIIMHNNLCFLMFFFRAVRVEMNLEVVQHWPWTLDTWGLPRIWLALWSDLAGTVQVGIHFRMSTRRWKDSLFFRVYICTYTDTIHIPHLWPMATTGTWTCPLILQELQENKWCNLLPGAWAGSDCLQWILLKVNFAGRGKTPHAAKILPD